MEVTVFHIHSGLKGESDLFFTHENAVITFTGNITVGKKNAKCCYVLLMCIKDVRLLNKYI